MVNTMDILQSSVEVLGFNGQFESFGMTDKQRVLPVKRSEYRHFTNIQTRWADNDVYGHVNNVVYYSWFDTAVNGYLIEQGVLDMHHGSTIGLVVQTQCDFFAPVAFPQAITAGLRVAHLGRSSVRYEVGIFADDAPVSNAAGHFVHVIVDRVTRKSVPLPDNLKAALHALMVHSI